MIRLMELSTALIAPDHLELKNPEKWKDEIKSFLQKTKECSGETLQRVSRSLFFYIQDRAKKFRMSSLSNHPGVIVSSP